MTSVHRRWGITAAAAALVVLLTGFAQPATAAVDTAAGRDDREARIAKLLESNPGSKRIDENAVQVADGIEIGFVADDRSAQGLADCPSGYQCGFTDTNFTGWVIRAQKCVYVDYTKFYWQHPNGAVDDFAYDVSSVFNNIPGVTWSQFWSPRNGKNYNAHVGAPEDWIGDVWNDSFTAAQGCSGVAH